MSTTNNETSTHTNETLQNQVPTAVHTYEIFQNQAPTAVHTNETLQNQAPTAFPSYQTSQNQAVAAVPNWNTQVPPFVQNVSSQFPAYYPTPSAQMCTIPTVAPQYSVARIAAPNSDPSSPFYQTFLKGKPRALGIVLIVSAILEIALGIGLVYTIFTITLPSGVTFWGPIFYIIAGSLTIAAHGKPNVCLVRGSLSLNIITSIFSIVAVILNIVDLVTIRCNSYLDGYYADNSFNSYYNRICRQRLVSRYAVLSILLIANLLLFCVSLSLSIFGCRSLSEVSSNGPQVFLIQNNGVVSMNPSTVPTTFSGVAQPFPTANAQSPPYVFSEAKARPM